MKPRCDTISAIEVVQVRLFATNDGPKVVGVFDREAGSSQHPLRPTLYQSPTIKNDWSICFWRVDAGNHGLKSQEAVRCAVTLRPIGFVDHAVWQIVTGSKIPENHQNLERISTGTYQTNDEESIKKLLEEVKTIVRRNR